MAGAHSSEFKQKVEEIAAKGNRPEDWKEYIDSLRNRAEDAPDIDEKWKYQLISFIYSRALKSIPASCQSLAHAQLIVEYADLQGSVCESDAEKCLSYGRRILKQFSIIHIATAEFELKRGNRDRAMKILKQAHSIGAKPAAEITKAAELLREGKTKLLCPEIKSDCENTLHGYLSSEKDSSGEVSTSQFSGVIRERTRETSQQVLPGCKTNTQEFEHGFDMLTQYTSHIRPTTTNESNKPGPSSSTTATSEVSPVSSVTPQNESKPSQPSSLLRVPEPPVLLSSLSDSTKDSQLRSQFKLTAKVAETPQLKLSSHILENSSAYKERFERTPNLQNLPVSGSLVGSARADTCSAKKTLLKYHSSPSVLSLAGSLKNSASARKPNLAPPRRVLKTHCEEDTDDDNEVGDITVSAFERFPTSRPSTVDLGFPRDSGTSNKSLPEQENHKPLDFGSVPIPTSSQQMPVSKITDTSDKHQAPNSLSSENKVLCQEQENKGKNDVLDPKKMRTEPEIELGRTDPVRNLPQESRHKEHCDKEASQPQIVREVPTQQQPVVLGSLSVKENIAAPTQEAQPKSSAGHTSYSLPSQKVELPNILTPAKPNIEQQPNQKTKYVNGKAYTVMKVAGRGGSAKVFQVFDPSTASNWALKVVDLSCANSLIVEGYKNEINLLEKLQHCDKVIKLQDWQYSESNKKLFLVMEYGETDLENFISQHSKNGEKLDLLDVKYFWRQMVRAVRAMHKEGVIHSDLKPANFMLVSGKVKLIDFGIARALQQDKTSVLKECMVGTPSYMSPEALVASTGPTRGGSRPKYKVGVRSDVWSLGCILYKMVYGHTPFQHIQQKFNAIVSPDHIIAFPELPDPQLMDILQKCLTRDVTKRPTTDQLLEHPYLLDSTESKPASMSVKIQLPEVENIASASPRSQKALLQRLKELQDQIASSLDSKLSAS